MVTWTIWVVACWEGRQGAGIGNNTVWVRLVLEVWDFWKTGILDYWNFGVGGILGDWNFRGGGISDYWDLGALKNKTFWVKGFNCGKYKNEVP